MASNDPIPPFGFAVAPSNGHRPYMFQITPNADQRGAHGSIGSITVGRLRGLVKLIKLPPNRRGYRAERDSVEEWAFSEISILRRIRDRSPFLAECIFSTWQESRGWDIACIVMTPYQYNMRNYLTDLNAVTPLTQIRQIALEILLGLHALHTRGIVHGDLKDENIMLDTPHLHVRIIDFSSSHRTSLRTGMLVDSGHCASPFSPPEDKDEGHMIRGDRLDVYSFGLIVWMMMTRRIGPHAGLRRWEDVIIPDEGDRSRFDIAFAERAIYSNEECRRHDVHHLLYRKLLHPDPDERPSVRRIFKYKLFNWIEDYRRERSFQTIKSFMVLQANKDIDQYRRSQGRKLMTIATMENIVHIWRLS